MSYEFSIRYRATTLDVPFFGLDRPELVARRFDFNAPYQRGLVWSIEQQQSLIGTLTTGLPMPAVFVREMHVLAVETPQYEVIDGKQRLNAIIGFMTDGFPYRGTLFSQWSKGSQRRFGNLSYGMVVVSEITDAEAVDIYEKINFCGVPHTKPSKRTKR